MASTREMESGGEGERNREEKEKGEGLSEHGEMENGVVEMSG